MNINYQLININNFEKINSILKLYQGVFDKIIIGDMSCLNRILSFTNNLTTLSKQISNFYLQLPLLTRENEFNKTLNLITKIKPKGIITGDLGIVKALNKKKTNIIYTTNIINSHFSAFLKNNFTIEMIRPLMHKRVFVEQQINYPKDVLIYGNMLLNCSTFCIYSNDQVKNCKINCLNDQKFKMHNENVHLIGRSIYTNKRFNLISRIGKIKNLTSTTILDYNLNYKELSNTVLKIKNATK